MNNSAEKAARYTQRAADLRKIVAETKDREARDTLEKVAEDYDQIILQLVGGGHA